MSTNIRSQISKKNPWYISKHRYYELKHFCLQYQDWAAELSVLDSFRPSYAGERVTGGVTPNPTAAIAEKRMRLSERIAIVTNSAKLAGNDLWKYLLTSVTEDIAYPKLCPPCCKEVWYEMYRKFFWILDTVRR